MSSYSAGYEEDKDVAASEGLLGYNQDKNILRTKTATGSSLFVLCLQVACMTLFTVPTLRPRTSIPCTHVSALIIHHSMHTVLV